MIFVVLGMHKSGTTLVSQILHHSGVNMGDLDTETSYDKGNKYERQDVLRLNLEILGADDFQVLHLARDPAAPLTEAQVDAMREIIARGQSASPDWGFKDPRCCLTYDHWAQVLPEHKLIVVYRRPDQIWPRFKWQGKRKYHTNFQRAYAFLERWHDHNLAILQVLSHTRRERVVFNYHDFMGGDQGLLALEEFCGRKLQDKRRPELYRSQGAGDIFLWTADRLLSWRRGRSIPDTMARLAAWDTVAKPTELD